jgi:hypothetical protein
MTLRIVVLTLGFSVRLRGDSVRVPPSAWYLEKVTNAEAMRWIENLYGHKKNWAAHQHTAPATTILRDSFREGEKFQKLISSGSSPDDSPYGIFTFRQVI